MRPILLCTALFVDKTDFPNAAVHNCQKRVAMRLSPEGFQRLPAITSHLATALNLTEDVSAIKSPDLG
jgi:hypothetical protein